MDSSPFAPRSSEQKLGSKSTVQVRERSHEVKIGAKDALKLPSGVVRIRLGIGAVPSAPCPGCPLIYSRIILANVPTDNAGYRVLRWTPRRCVGDRGA